MCCASPECVACAIGAGMPDMGGAGGMPDMGGAGSGAGSGPTVEEVD